MKIVFYLIPLSVFCKGAELPNLKILENELVEISRQNVANHKYQCKSCEATARKMKHLELVSNGYYKEAYNPIKVTKDTFGAKKNIYGRWTLPIGHPMWEFINQGYMIHPRSPNALIPNPHTNKGRALIKKANTPRRSVGSHAWKPKPKPADDYEYKDGWNQQESKMLNNKNKK